MKGKNTNTPGKNKNGSGTKQNDGGGLGILGNPLVTGAGIAGGTGAMAAADKILGHGEQGDNSGNSENGKNSQKGQKNRDSNGPSYTYVDSTEKVITKAEGKQGNSDIEEADTDASDTEQPEMPNGAGKIEETKAEGKGVSDNIENADTDVPDTEHAEMANEAENRTEKAEKTEEGKGES